MRQMSLTKCSRNSGVKRKFKVLSSFSVCPRGQWRLRNRTTAQTQTFAVIGPRTIWSSNWCHFTNKDFPRGQVRNEMINP
jgi:hypothetical protein